MRSPPIINWLVVKKHASFALYADGQGRGRDKQIETGKMAKWTYCDLDGVMRSVTTSELNRERRPSDRLSVLCTDSAI